MMLLKKSILAVITAFILVACTEKNELSQWRGPNRDGKYLQTGLLKQWPEKGPELIWSYEGLGAGHGSVSVAKDQIFVLGMPDTIGVIYSFDLEGKLLWQQEYGLEWYANYTGSRSTPTIVDELLYFISGQGVAICMDKNNGEVIWRVDMFESFEAQPTWWGIAESPLVYGDRIIVTPGGLVHNVVALNRYTGETIWSSKGNGEQSAYCSPILVEHNETRLVVTMTSESVLGIDAENGETLWRVPHKQGNKINANSPVYDGSRVFSASAQADTIKGHLMIRLSADGRTAEEGWRNEELFNLLGGIIVHEGSLYSPADNKKGWYCIDAGTGKLNYVSNEISSGATIFADGLFYCYGKDGVLSLIKADEKECRVLSSFEVPLGTNQHWAHPVISDGRIYVRHGDALMCYNIAEN